MASTAKALSTLDTLGARSLQRKYTLPLWRLSRCAQLQDESNPQEKKPGHYPGPNLTGARVAHWYAVSASGASSPALAASFQGAVKVKPCCCPICVCKFLTRCRIQYTCAQTCAFSSKFPTRRAIITLTYYSNRLTQRHYTTTRPSPPPTPSSAPPHPVDSLPP